MSAVQGPAPASAELRTFPVVTLSAGQAMFRAHHASRDAWWFDNGPGGRFNLRDDRGTCCTATSLATAVRERVRENVTRDKVVDTVFADEFVVSTVVAPVPFECAAVSHDDAANHGVVRELVSMHDYAVPQGWAAALDGAGFDGVFYGSAYTTGDPSAYALFGPAGAPASDAGYIETRFMSGAAACRALGWTVSTPHSSGMTVID
ncbi:RES family NAD+ phosphorylase [Microbacterium sp. NPDC055665]